KETIKVADQPINLISYTPHGQILVATSGWLIYILITSHEIISLRGHKGKIISISVSPDGKLLATVSEDNTAKIWSLSSRKEIASLSEERTITHASFSADGKYLSASFTDGSVRVWEINY